MSSDGLGASGSGGGGSKRGSVRGLASVNEVEMQQLGHASASASPAVGLGVGVVGVGASVASNVSSVSPVVPATETAEKDDVGEEKSVDAAAAGPGLVGSMMNPRHSVTGTVSLELVREGARGSNQ